MEKVKFTYESNVLTAKILGDIDHHSARFVREKIDNVIFDKKPVIILLDLSLVDFMDSSGLGLILGRYSLAKDLGCEFKLYKPCPAVKKILSLAGIERLMKIEGDN